MSQRGNPFRKHSVTNAECKMAYAPDAKPVNMSPCGPGLQENKEESGPGDVSIHRADGSWLISFRVLRMQHLMPCGFKAGFFSDANGKTERERGERGLASEVHASPDSPGPRRSTPHEGTMERGPSQAPESLQVRVPQGRVPGAYPPFACHQCHPGRKSPPRFRGELPTTSENLQTSATLPDSDGTRHCSTPTPMATERHRKSQEITLLKQFSKRSTFKMASHKHTPPPRDTPAW